MSISTLQFPDVRSYRFITPNTPDAAKLARDHVAWLLKHARSPVAIDVAQLLVSELVTNAHQHTTAPRVALTTTIHPAHVHVDVYDTDPRPLPATASGSHLDAERGRGLLILRQLATRWDWELCGGRFRPYAKHVWFELHHRPDPAGGGGLPDAS